MAWLQADQFVHICYWFAGHYDPNPALVWGGALGLVSRLLI